MAPLDQQDMSRTSDSRTTDISHYAHRRAAIDLIATLRARMIRCAFFATNILRPHPVAPEPPDKTAAWKKAFETQYAGILRSYNLLDGRDPDGAVPQDICDWIAESAQNMPDQIAVMQQMLKLTQNVRDSLDGEKPTLDAALTAYFECARGAFYDAVTAFCDGLWSQLDAKRDADMKQATEAGNAIGDVLERLEKIGKHVRLVSLNASVEAARVGDAGRGLGVIAVEFKALAEEIQQLASSARTDIACLTRTDS